MISGIVELANPLESSSSKAMDGSIQLDFHKKTPFNLLVAKASFSAAEWSWSDVD